MSRLKILQWETPHPCAQVQKERRMFQYKRLDTSPVLRKPLPNALVSGTDPKSSHSFTDDSKHVAMSYSMLARNSRLAVQRQKHACRMPHAACRYAQRPLASLRGIGAV